VAAAAVAGSAPIPFADTLIVSDVHLGLRTSRPGRLLETLRHWRFNRLILLGDILHDGARHRFCADSWALLHHVRDLAAARAAEVVWLHGNHDRHLAPLIGEIAGVEVVESYAWTVAGQSYLAVHGDRFDWFNHNFTKVGNLIGKVYAFSLRRLSRDGHWPGRLDKLQGRLGNLHRKVARKAAAFAFDHGVDVIVCGHTHRPAKQRFRHPRRPGEVVYVNAGSWVDRPASFLTVDAAGVHVNHAW
jgi:UDP-2,3-diacylglucosamine pyrophosphatase LpxH